MLRDRADSQADHRRFVERVASFETVWLLRGEKGVAYCQSNEDPERHVLIFWSDRAYASRAAKAQFPDHEVSSIELFDFLFRWLPGMAGDGALAGTNWTGTLTGLEAEPTSLQEEIVECLSADKRAQYMDRLKRGLDSQRKNERA